ncbi:hypothetical protein [Nocardia macrotermitis]|uniref:Uncharacterized protein n=1 Tax=Nocardia macrotermitis TaxID=2585198 RepID=A0A7K0CY17_9NOCA|nr:hypothetical protein [Nocardia macrotermitis]MQY18395.1 hypothetical protein [Nocardia macrotermitis]
MFVRHWKRVYGAHPLHLLVLLAAFALAAYTVWTLGFDTLWNHHVWWQAIGIWFAAAIIAHDLLLFPAYALLDRTLTTLSTRFHPRIPPLNHLRIPLLGTGLSFLIFFPGIIEQGATTFHTATGATQQPFLLRWILLSTTMFAVSGVVYAIRILRAWRRPRP